MSFTEILSLALGAILVENLVLNKVIGTAPFFLGGQETKQAAQLGLVVTGFIVLASVCLWPIERFVLVGLGLSYLRTMIYVLVIGLLTFLTGTQFKKIPIGLFGLPETELPLVIVNGAIMGAVLLQADMTHPFLETLLYGLFVGAGFLLASVLFADLRERQVDADCPRAFQGMPITLVTAGLLAMVFLGLSGLKLG